ncbi:MAG: type II toxin-antitoxin system RelE/ParE family toxin [Saccharofermentans sp.]|nr:type II toxin-antitoxin system RelE/ParE family toxin [Saccharofermentans sp.]
MLNSNNLLKKRIGLELSRSIKKRYDQIIAFSSFLSFQKSGIGKLESLEGNLKGSYSLRVSANYRLILKPKTVNRSAESLRTCDTVIIEGVIDYHGKGNKYSWIVP